MTLRIEPFAFEFFYQSRSVESQQLRGAAGDTIGFAQGFPDQTIFVLLEFFRQIDPIFTEANELF